MRTEAGVYHVRDLYYRGHEIVILRDAEGYMADVREDEYDGAYIQGFYGITSEALAEWLARSCIDGLEDARLC